MLSTFRLWNFNIILIRDMDVPRISWITLILKFMSVLGLYYHFVMELWYLTKLSEYVLVFGFCGYFELWCIYIFGSLAYCKYLELLYGNFENVYIYVCLVMCGVRGCGYFGKWAVYGYVGWSVISMTLCTSPGYRTLENGYCDDGMDTWICRILGAPLTGCDCRSLIG